MSDLVSIITPVFNSEKYIAETILSVKNQTYTNWELIIVDDCSSDSTTLIINKFLGSDKRILLIKNQVNLGSGYSRQNALDIARGKYIAFLDADDLWHHKKLEKQVDFLKTKNLYFTFSFYSCIDENSKTLEKHVSAPNPLKLSQLKYCNHIGNLTGIYDTDYFGKINISKIRKRQDWIMWLEVLKRIKVAYPLPEYLAYYRKTNQSLSANKWCLIKYNYKVYTDFWNYSKVMSIYYMMIFLFHQLILKRRHIKTTPQIV